MRPTLNAILSIIGATVWVGWFGYVIWRDRQDARQKLREALTPWRNAFRDKVIAEEFADGNSG